MNDRYYMPRQDCMYIYHLNGDTDVMMEHDRAIYTLSVHGVAKHPLEKGDDL